ncbi:hypothetical protein [Streptantibioticus rubrisoli]|uniref:hypothetical protein n=1 Tax=Streptantibioticus rubrisoli TaxID=1387313 RepID=UPI0036D3B36D
MSVVWPGTDPQASDRIRSATATRETRRPLVSEAEPQESGGGLELAGQSDQLGGVAGQALELVDGEDDLLVGAASEWGW